MSPVAVAPSGIAPPTPSSTNAPTSAALKVPAAPTSAAEPTLVVATRVDGVAAGSGTRENAPGGALTSAV